MAEMWPSSGDKQHNAPPTVLANARPYQGVRVRDPVKELLRRKRGLEPHTAKAALPTAAVETNSNQPSYAQGSSGFELASSSSSNSVDLSQATGWRAQPAATAASGLQPALTSWSFLDYSQQEPSSQILAYPASPILTADMYMQNVCPSYTLVGPPAMLTYTHTPLLTNFGTIPVASVPASLPQVDLQDSGLAYIPWAQPLTTISTIPTSGIHFTPCSAPLPGSSLVHMPLPMSLTTMIPQLENQCLDPQPLPMDLPQPTGHQLSPEPKIQSLETHHLDEDPEVEPESPNPLEKFLEDPKEEEDEEGKDSASNSLFIPSV